MAVSISRSTMRMAWARTLGSRDESGEAQCSPVETLDTTRPASSTFRRRSPTIPVDLNSGQRAQLELRHTLVSSLLLLAACRHSVKPPEIAPVVDVPDAVPMPAPVVTPPAVPDRTPLIASAWPLGSRVQAV